MNVLTKTLTLSAIGLSSFAAAQEKKPNIVFIMADDMGWTDLGCMGSDYYESPNIDDLFSKSLKFTQAYAACPNSAPSRATFMTGLYSPRHGVYTVGTSERGDSEFRKLIPYPNTEDVRGDFVTMAEMLQENGYQCGHVGKWHLGLDGEGTGPLDQGFVYNVAGCRAGAPYSYFYPYRNANGNHDDLVPGGHPGEYLTDRLTDEAIRFIKQYKDGPFFLYLAHHAIHTPLRAPEDLIEKFRQKEKGEHHKNQVLAAMIYNLDLNVGRIRATLDELGLTENTILIFMSDNGGPVPITDNYPLRGGKGMPYEGGIRVPLSISWPGHITPGTTDVVVSGIDFYPTFAEIAGARPAPYLDGEPIQDILKGKKRDLFLHFPAYLQASGKGKFRCTPFSMIRSEQWKLIYYFEDQRYELFDIVSDISETTDLSAQRPDMVRKLSRRLHRWQRQTDAPVEFELNPQYEHHE